MSIIKGDNISLKYSNTTKNVLKNVNFEIKEKRFNLFIGRSGSGKTTLLKCIANLINNYQGKITCNNTLIKKMSVVQKISLIGFVFQKFNLFSNMTVLENCIHPQMHILKHSLKQAKQKTEELLEKLEISFIKNKYPSQLSGGQQQRVAIARALCMNSKILLLDEPTSALDPASTKQLQELLISLKNQGITIVISSHDMAFVKNTIDIVYFMQDGCIVEYFDLQKDQLPTSSKTSQFMEHI